jgi:hypothetical protein
MSDPAEREGDRPAGYDPREEAKKQVQRRRGLEGGAVAFVVVNAGLIAVWAATGGGYFWPGWVIGAWGIGLVLAFWDYRRGPITDAEIDAEMKRRH